MWAWKTYGCYQPQDNNSIYYFLLGRAAFLSCLLLRGWIKHLVCPPSSPFTGGFQPSTFLPDVILLGYLSLKCRPLKNKKTYKKKKNFGQWVQRPQLSPRSATWPRASNSSLLGLSFPLMETAVERQGPFQFSHFVFKYHTVPFSGNRQLYSEQAIYTGDQ